MFVCVWNYLILEFVQFFFLETPNQARLKCLIFTSNGSVGLCILHLWG